MDESVALESINGSWRTLNRRLRGTGETMDRQGLLGTICHPVFGNQSGFVADAALALRVCELEASRSGQAVSANPITTTMLRYALGANWAEVRELLVHAVGLDSVSAQRLAAATRLESSDRMDALQAVNRVAPRRLNAIVPIATSACWFKLPAGNQAIDAITDALLGVSILGYACTAELDKHAAQLLWAWESAVGADWRTTGEVKKAA